MRTSHRAACLVISLVLATAFVSARQSAQTANRQTANRERTLYVSAVDDKGEPVDGLGAEAFIVREDNRPREVLRVSRATEPIDVALLVDNSAASDGITTFMREALTKFVAAMSGAKHRFTLIGLAERPTILVQYTTDTAPISAAINRLFSIGGSGMTMLDGIYETARGMRRQEGPRAVIIPVVTDGIEFTNRYSKDVVAAARDAGAALHLVTIGTFPYREEHSIRERTFLLSEGPRETGGQQVSLLAPHALATSMERLARELSGQYKVVYGRPDSLYATGKVDIASARPGITMRGGPARGETGATK